MSKPANSVPRFSPRWTDDRRARVRSGLAVRTKRRRALERTGVAIGLAALVGIAALVATRFLHRDAELASRAAPPTVATAPTPPPSDVTSLLDPSSEVVPEPEAEHRSFRLRKGGARFTVVHDARRPFRVKVGSAVVEDVGTIFTLRRVSETAAEVIVSEGRVHVSATDGSFDVGAGERRTFATDADAANAVAEPESHTHAVASWRPLAESGRFGEAYAVMKATGANTVRDETGELLLAADVARLSGHPADAVPYLERILRSRGSDPRAGLAAFTLGRVLLEELGRPAEAARAFARARKAGGPLAEDALAREVEASSRAGDTGSARSLALEYQKQYPNGRRMRRVVKFGGID